MSDELRDTFFQECEDLLEVLESGLLDLSNGEGDDETVNAVFRAVHSIKGGAGAFGLEECVRYAHKFETALDGLREKRLAADSDTIAVFLRSSDILSDLVRALRDGGMVNDDAIAESTVELSKLIGVEEEEEEDANYEPMALDFGIDLPDDDEPEGPRALEVFFQPHSSLYQRGNETTLMLRALEALGEVEIECVVESLPGLEHLSAEDAALAWRIKLVGEISEDAVREVFEFVTDDCELEISAVEAAPDGGEEESDLLLDGPAQEELTAEEAVAESVASGEPSTPPQTEFDANAAPPQAVATAAAPEPAAIPEAVAPPAAKATSEEKPASAQPSAAKKAPEAPKQTVRVDLERIEKLINLVGELVINQAMLSQRISESGEGLRPEMSEGLEEFRRLTRDIQESVMAIRAQPVKPLFQRMTRIVREAASATGKRVRLVSEGEGTEVDKTIVERLSDPLTHMIRNAVDHGLEAPDVRAASGKDEEGRVTLSATHRSGRIVIEVSDDGAGINREKVKAIAIEKGLIQEDVVLTDSEIDNLLFMPGFSTAKVVSDLSGRGVGMDVVKRAIQALGGRTSIASEPGRGTVFSISLPLTLAVLDGIVVSVSEQTIVVPLTNISETFRPGPNDVKGLGSGSRVVLVRGDPLPIIDVAFDLGFRDEPLDPSNGVFIITETHEGGQNALLVDDIFDQRQVVIKGLDANYGSIPGIAAATILGDGRIALILDVDVIVEGVTAPVRRQEIALAG